MGAISAYMIPLDLASSSKSTPQCLQKHWVEMLGLAKCTSTWTLLLHANCTQLNLTFLHVSSGLPNNLAVQDGFPSAQPKVSEKCVWKGHYERQGTASGWLEAASVLFNSKQVILQYIQDLTLLARFTNETCKRVCKGLGIQEITHKYTQIVCGG